MKDKFIELIKNEFRIEYLESQLVGLSEIDLKEFLLFSMNEFEKIKVEGWLKIIEAYHDTGIVYLYESDFDKNYFGSFGFYLEDIDTTQTPLYMISEIHLTDFINQCNRILKYGLVSQIKTKTDKLRVPVIALIHIYEGIQITDENSKEIAAQYGYIAKNSGKGLYQDYLKYYKTSDRKAKPTAETKKTLINKIELFESVLNHLSDKAKPQANDEIKILKTILENEYQ
jgi:hypothetical protein